MSAIAEPRPAATSDRLPFDVRPFLSTHRAEGACTRELARVLDTLVRDAATLPASGSDEKVVVRRSPGRCVVQVGTVAVTVAWLRANQSPLDEGELLAVVWRGVIAPRGDHMPERAPLQRSSSATALWEQVFAPAAETAEAWGWRQVGAGSEAHTSGDLAALCLEQLRRAHDDQQASTSSRPSRAEPGGALAAPRDHTPRFT